MAKHKYSVMVRDEVPNFEAERRYLMTEREYARRKANKASKSWWLGLLGPGLGVVRRGDWLKYLRELDRYERTLAREAQNADDGLIPCSFVVKHEGHEADHHIEVRVMVRGGRFRLKKKVPVRPVRVDGAPDYRPNQPHFTGFQGFVRHHTKLEANGLGAVFSKLGSKDQATALFDPVYLEYEPATRLFYEIKSKQLPEGQKGEIEL
jgi:hypothetical protein